MASVVVSSLADADADGILEHLIGEAGPRTAARYAARFERLYDRLTTHPPLGPRRPALGALARIGIVWPYIVIYEYEPAADRVSVLRIVHGHRRISGRMLRDR